MPLFARLLARLFGHGPVPDPSPPPPSHEHQESLEDWERELVDREVARSWQSRTAVRGPSAAPGRQRRVGQFSRSLREGETVDPHLNHLTQRRMKIAESERFSKLVPRYTTADIDQLLDRRLELAG